MSFIIDYHDPYATVESGIMCFNFYRYSRSPWKWFNPPNHNQNRVRHSDYEVLFAGSGLQTLEHRPVIPPGSDKGLEDMPLSKVIQSYSADDLMALNGFFLLKVDRAFMAQLGPGKGRQVRKDVGRI